MNDRGYTLIELVVFIVVIGITASTILLTLNAVVRNSPVLHRQSVAVQAAKQCAEWFIGQRYLNGYSSITCPSYTVPAYCTAPSGYVLTVDVTCTTLDGYNDYKTVTINVGGGGYAKFSLLLADY